MPSLKLILTIAVVATVTNMAVSKVIASKQ